MDFNHFINISVCGVDPMFFLIYSFALSKNVSNEHDFIKIGGAFGEDRMQDRHV